MTKVHVETFPSTLLRISKQLIHSFTISNVDYDIMTKVHSTCTVYAKYAQYAQYAQYVEISIKDCTILRNQ
jgi:hypothetical protein